MFGSGKKKAQAEAAETLAAENIENSVHVLVEDTRQEIAKIEKISDAGERYLAFVNAESTIHRLMEDLNQKVEKQIESLQLPRISKYNNIGMSLRVAGFVTGLGVPTAAIIIFGLPWLIAGCFAGAVGVMATCKAAEKVEAVGNSPRGDNLKKIIEIKDGVGKTMGELLTHITFQKDAIIQSEISSLVASKHIEELCDKVPAIKDAFTKACIKDGVLRPTVILDKKPSPRTPKQ